ncbi:hypothetical protein D9Q98_004844 [Chlorella vulgaris]|uniref:C3H1-type domain-containing protein n=1 Tax=Chlorella vulgaris TaxID=3077 RepID=A0A9D4TN59_CHLVU|nr:hypothetical protein D9Q98_004844 [Chlorella vulgaris]
MDDLTFDFERGLESHPSSRGGQQAADDGMGRNGEPKPRNYRMTVCTYWLRGLCMKGDTCGFLHQFDPDRMPVCRSLLKFGVCKEPDCPYKHTMEAIKECNMYKLGFCIYGPACRFKHTRQTGHPPDPETLEAAKPREHRNLNIVANQANENIMPEREYQSRGPRRRTDGGGGYMALPAGGGSGNGGGNMQMQQYGGGPGAGGRPGQQSYQGQPGGTGDPSLLASVGQADFRYGF